MEKALIGGISFLKKNWLSNYQNTLYQNKFDIDLRSGSSLYTHQYMQNLSAAYSEARTLRSCYSSTGKLDSSFTFVIPIYENMPQQVSPKPSGSGGSSSSSGGTSTSSNLGPMDAKVINVSAGSSLNLRESASTSSAVQAKLKSGEHVLSIERAVNGNWQKVVTDNGKIGYVSGDYLQFVADVTNCNVKKTVSTDGSTVFVRSGPSTSLKEITSIPKGTQVTVINTGTYSFDGYLWDRVILNNGVQGFIANQFLK